MSVDWAAARLLPPWMRAGMAALQLDRPSFDALNGLRADDWRPLLGWLDRQQMTLLFGHACAGRLPPDVEARIGRNLDANRARLARLRDEHRAIAKAFKAAGIPHVVLKGFTHGPPFVPAPELRPQYDLDLLVNPDCLAAARNVLHGLGFERVESRETTPTDHGPPLVRRTGWTWRGDYFDPEIPTVVELHFRLWDEATEGFAAPGLTPEDRLSYAAAHALRHLLRGSLKALHVYEIARFLYVEREHRRWCGWTEVNPPGLRRLETVMYRLAQAWFGCALPSSVEAEATALPPPIRRWLEHYALSPLAREAQPNKDELWLHLELIEGWRGRVRVARRRLAPLTLPGRLDGQYDRVRPAVRERLRRGMRYVGYAGRRLAFHARSLARTLLEASRWLGERRSLH